MVVCNLFIVFAEVLQLFLSCLATSLNSEQSLFFEVKTMLVLIACKSSSVDIEVLVLVLALVFTLKSLKVFQVLLLQPQLKVFELDYLLLVVVNCLSHPIFFIFDDQELHFNSLLHV